MLWTFQVELGGLALLNLMNGQIYSTSSSLWQQTSLEVDRIACCSPCARYHNNHLDKIQWNHTTDCSIRVFWLQLYIPLEYLNFTYKWLASLIWIELAQRYSNSPTVYLLAGKLIGTDSKLLFEWSDNYCFVSNNLLFPAIIQLLSIHWWLGFVFVFVYLHKFCKK